MRTAIVHDGFVRPGGAERVVEALARAFEDAVVHVGGFLPERLPATLSPERVAATFLQPLVARGVPLPVLAPLLPIAFSRLDVGPVDLVVSSSAAFAHHVRVPRDAAHVCYIHTPPRFLWEAADYFRGQPARRLVTAPGRAALRLVDQRAAPAIDCFVANSEHVARRVRRVYGREALVVHPPVDLRDFRPTTERSGRFVIVSRLRNQKRIDLAIEAANVTGLPLDVIGEGPELARLRRMAGPTVRFLGRRPDDDVRSAMARSAGVIVPAVQDFGLTLVEAQASGRPPIAFAEGGALEVVDDGVSGFLFSPQTPEGLAEAMTRAMRSAVDPDVLVGSARRFDEGTFRSRIREVARLAVAQRASRPLRESRLPRPATSRARSALAPLRHGHDGR